MKQLWALFMIAGFGLFGCGGGGGAPQPANVEGKWVGTMDHNMSGEVVHYGTALILLQEGTHVTGTMILEYGTNGHGGHIEGEMHGSHFSGTRSARHVASIEFDVTADTLFGTFSYVNPAENLNEHGTFICTRRAPGNAA